jgi:hypothetical protein
MTLTYCNPYSYFESFSLFCGIIVLESHGGIVEKKLLNNIRVKNFSNLKTR